MVQDIKLMKQLNFNAVRAAHYPNHPRWCASPPSPTLDIDQISCQHSHQEAGPSITAGSDANPSMLVLLCIECKASQGSR